MIRIEGYQKHKDNCTAKIVACENQIMLYCGRIIAQQETIRSKTQEAVNLCLEADLLRKEADLNCLPGIVECEIHGMNKNSKHCKLLQKAEEKQQIPKSKKVKLG